MIYRSDGMNAVRQARGLDDAGRIFAHRLGRGLFGRSGGYWRIRRLYPLGRQPHKAAIYRAKLRGPHGLSSWVEFVVSARPV